MSSRSTRQSVEDDSLNISPLSIVPPPAGQSKFQSSAAACTPTQKNTPSSPPTRPTWASIPPSPPTSPTRPTTTTSNPLTQTPQSTVKVKSVPAGRSKTTAKVNSPIKKQSSVPLVPITKNEPSKSKPTKFTPLRPKRTESIRSVTTPKSADKPISQLLFGASDSVPNIRSASAKKGTVKSTKNTTRPVDKPPPVLEEEDDLEWDDRSCTYKKTEAAREREEKEKQRVSQEESKKQRARVESETREEEAVANDARERGEALRTHGERLREMQQKREREMGGESRSSETRTAEKEEIMQLHEKQLRDRRKQQGEIEKTRQSETGPDHGGIRGRPALWRHEHAGNEGNLQAPGASPQRIQMKNSYRPLNNIPATRTQPPSGKQHQNTLGKTDAHNGLLGEHPPGPSSRRHEPSEMQEPLEISDTEVSEAEDPVDRSRTRRSTSRKQVYHINLEEDEIQMPTSAQPSRKQVARPTPDRQQTLRDPFPYMKDGQLDPDYVSQTPQLTPRARVSQTQSDPPDSFDKPIRLEERKGKSESQGRAPKMSTYSKRLPKVYVRPRGEKLRSKLSPEPGFQREYDRSKRKGSTSLHVEEKVEDEGMNWDGTGIADGSDEYDLDTEEEPTRRKATSAQTRNGQWPRDLRGIFNSPPDAARRAHHPGSLRPVSERFHAKNPEDIDNLPRAGYDDDSRKSSKRKRRRVVDYHSADDIRRMPRPELRLSKKSRVDDNIQGYVQQVNRHHKKNPQQGPSRPGKPRPQVVAENVPEHVLKPIIRMSFKDIKAEYAKNRQQELDEERAGDAAPRVAVHPVNPHLIRAVEKGMRREELAHGVRRRARKSGRSNVPIVPMERTLGKDWDDTPAETIGEWTPSLATGSRGSSTRHARERVQPMAGRVPPLRFTATEEVDEDEEEEVERSRTDTRGNGAGSDNARYQPPNFTNTTASNGESNAQPLDDGIPQAHTLSSGPEGMFEPDLPDLGVEPEIRTEVNDRNDGGKRPESHVDSSQARAEAALQAMEEEEMADARREPQSQPEAAIHQDVRQGQAAKSQASQRDSRSKTPGSGAVSASQLSRFIEEIDQAHPDLMSKSPSTSARAKISQQKTAVCQGGVDLKGAVTVDAEPLDSPPQDDLPPPRPSQRHISQPIDEIDSRTPSQEHHVTDADNRVIQPSPTSAPQIQSAPKQLNGLEMTEQLFQLAQTLPEQPKSKITSAPSRRSKIQERAKRLQERRNQIPEPERGRQRKMSEYNASPVRMGLSREVSVGTKNIVNARVLKRKYAESSQAVLSQPYKAPRWTAGSEVPEVAIATPSYEHGRVILGEEDEEMEEEEEEAEEPEDQENVPLGTIQHQSPIRQTSVLINPQYKTPTGQKTPNRQTPLTPSRPSKHPSTTRHIPQPPIQEDHREDIQEEDQEDELEDIVPSLPLVPTVTARTSKGSSSTGTGTSTSRSRSTTIRTPFTSPLKKMSSAPVLMSTSRQRQRSLGVRPSSVSGKLNAEYKEPYRSEEAVMAARDRKGKGKMKEVVQVVTEEDEYDAFDGDDELLGSIDVGDY